MRATVVALAVALAACTTPPKRDAVVNPSAPTVAQAQSPLPERHGGYYKDDGPGANPPDNLDSLPDAIPRLEPLSRFANRPYSVFGRDYVPATSLRPYSERGIASWYGRKFHNQKTSTGEIYDMYAMTAAHPTLPLPSYARVTSLITGKSVVVRVNDRGPFHAGRIIDLSYAAAYRIGIAQAGSGEVQVESVFASDTPPQPVLPLPTVAAIEAVPATPIPVAPAPGGFDVQLGAFANNLNAQAFVEHVANQIAPLGVEAKVHEQGGLYRVSVGPYPTRDDARRTADRLRTALGLDSTIKVR